MTIAYRAFLDLQAKRRPSVPLDEHVDIRLITPDAEAEQLGEAERVNRLVAGLPESVRQVVVLHYSSELSLKQTAAAMGVPVGCPVPPPGQRRGGGRPGRERVAQAVGGEPPGQQLAPGASRRALPASRQAWPLRRLQERRGQQALKRLSQGPFAGAALDQPRGGQRQGQVGHRVVEVGEPHLEAGGVACSDLRWQRRRGGGYDPWPDRNTCSLDCRSRT